MTRDAVRQILDGVRRLREKTGATRVVVRLHPSERAIGLVAAIARRFPDTSARLYFEETMPVNYINIQADERPPRRRGARR